MAAAGPAPVVAPAAPATITIIPELDALLRAPPAAQIAPVAPIAAAAAGNFRATADSSIFVPLKQKGGGGYDEDSLITISSLINQWYHWTGDTAVPANYTNFGALSGIIQPGGANPAGLSNPAANVILKMFNGNHQGACEFLEAAVATAQVPPAAALTYTTLQNYIWNMPSNAANNQGGARFAAQGGNALAALTPTDGMCWADMLDAGYNHLAAAPILQAGEAYIPDVANAAAPTPSTAPAAPPAANAPTLRPPSYLVRYAFGLLYRIKQILGEEGWSGAHWQIAFGGKKKSSRFTHRKKQYSQRRYKK
jgi:hypothetical protein